MKFKAARIYTLKQPLDLSTFDEDLAKLAFVPCSGLRAESAGWVAPFDGAPGLFRDAREAIALKLRKQKKAIPASALADALKEKVDKHTELFGSAPSVKVKRDLKDDCIAEMTPDALPVTASIDMLIFDKFICIGTSSAADAELALTTLRSTLGTLPVLPLASCNEPKEAFTEWLSDYASPEGTFLGCNFDLIDSQHGSKAKFRSVEPSEDVTGLIRDGMSCTKIQLSTQDLHFSVDNNLAFSSIIDRREISDEIDAEEDPDARYDADVILAADMLRLLINTTITALGGSPESTEKELLAPPFHSNCPLIYLFDLID